MLKNKYRFKIKYFFFKKGGSIGNDDDTVIEEYNEPSIKFKDRNYLIEIDDPFYTENFIKDEPIKRIDTNFNFSIKFEGLRGIAYGEEDFFSNNQILVGNEILWNRVSFERDMYGKPFICIDGIWFFKPKFFTDESQELINTLYQDNWYPEQNLYTNIEIWPNIQFKDRTDMDNNDLVISQNLNIQNIDDIVFNGDQGNTIEWNSVTFRDNTNENELPPFEVVINNTYYFKVAVFTDRSKLGILTKRNNPNSFINNR